MTALARWGFAVALCITLTSGNLAQTLAQPPQDAAFQSGRGAEGAAENLPVDAETVRSLMQPEPQSAGTAGPSPSGIDLLSLITRGGGFMIPIGLMSMLVVALVVERSLSLRGRRLIPKRLVRDLNELCEPLDRFNPGTALQICDKYPSPAATAIGAMLMRTGQPLADIERAATEAIQREADDHAAPIRWLSLAAAATPLMGLLGTVWGMIVAFHDSTMLTPDRSRSEQLSAGIYTALVTTLAGLVVAIPAAIFAQYLENRLAKHFHRIERLAFDIAPGLSRFTGRARLHRDGTLQATLQAMAPLVSTDEAAAVNPAATDEPPVVAAPPAIASRAGRPLR